MPYKPGILLGQITKTRGFEGAVVVRLEKRFTENIPELESVFLEVEGRPVPFLISTLEYSGGDILKLSFNGYDSQGKVNEFKGCKVFLTTGHGEGQQESELMLLSGYSVFDPGKKPVGTIREIISNPGQLLLSIDSAGGKQFMVPLHENLIISIDRKRKKIVMEIPDGIREINN